MPPIQLVNTRAERIATLNDAVRKAIGLPFNPGRVVMTAGVATLPDAERTGLLLAVRDFDRWDAGDNPYGERDFGALYRVERCGGVYWTMMDLPEQEDGETRRRAFFKIDYYAKDDFGRGSEDPSDPDRTTRVLTIMLGEEY